MLTKWGTAEDRIHQLFGHSRSKEIYTISKSSTSGMTHRIRFYAVKDDSIINITEDVAQVLNIRLDKQGYAIFGGGQMNHRENAVQKISEYVFLNDRYIKHNTLALF